MKEHIFTVDEVIALDHNIMQREGKMKQILKENGFDLSKPMFCHHDGLNDQIVYRQKENENESYTSFGGV